MHLQNSFYVLSKLLIIFAALARTRLKKKTTVSGFIQLAFSRVCVSITSAYFCCVYRLLGESLVSQNSASLFVYIYTV